MKDGANLHVLIIEESSGDAESLANALRNAGHCISFNHGSNPGEIETAVQQQHPDIVVCGSGETLPTADTVLTLLKKYALTPPLIVIAEETTEAR